ncbi:MAG: hypothetical protein A2Y77_13585 [Planctomycetes bacterium RBG_13_62_9]|nr:MAG: hypothetical protein A2Y77_13585 [Planctomycetes bacterium RBG_13_62_9]
MKAKDSRLLVVDASVARSAGETEHPVSSACRDALERILKVCHRVIMTEAIRLEWNKHQSRFTRIWYRSMVARRKIRRAVGTPINPAPEAIEALSAGERENLRKDLCLIEAACDGDGIILTRDDVIVAIWQKCQDGFRLPKPIRWINPVTDDKGALKHL